MAAHLPSLGTLSISKSEGSKGEAVKKKQKNAATSFLSRLQLGSLQQMPQPGDVYRGSATVRRPLGLLPHHQDRLTALKKLNELLSPWALGRRPAPPPPSPLPPHSTWPPAAEPSHLEQATISATVHPKTQQVTETQSELRPLLSGGMVVDTTPYRLKASCDPTAKDPDYMGDKANEYYALIGAAPLPTPRPSVPPPPPPPQPTTTTTTSTTSSITHKGEKKKAKLQRNDHAAVSAACYVNFTGQAQLFERGFTDDRRTALEYEPCERCRLRGTRCSKCKALRTGGGYIILDGGEDPGLLLHRHRKSYNFKWSGASSDSGGVARSGGGRGGGVMGVDESGGGSGVGLGMGEGGEGGEGGERRGGKRGRWGLEGGGEGLGGCGEGQSHDESSARRERDTLKANGTLASITEQDGMLGGEGEGDGKDSAGGADDGSDLGGRVSSHGDVGDESGRQSHASRVGSRVGVASRPGSTLGQRPGSSLRGGSRGRERGGRGRGVADGEGGYGRGRQRRGGEEEDDDNEKGGKRKKKKRGEDMDGEDKGHDYLEGHYDYSRERDEDGRGGYRGNLRKFRRQRDNVKALHATLKELQGIDPLDYLAKYCIIDQAKLPHYQHAFNNVDRDEDDEIDIAELDFALKAVNYDLISDAEMNYVHSVLELAGRYCLNFRLFSLIAALSEKVVALDDMVKRLINKMDFDALEVKMKKCKELFYLLADSDDVLEHEGGVVTTSSLAVELQAGGLTQEHVEFVVDRLNHEGKGLVEFLDYLTYVPLFVEIHDTISGNPLDFSRTK